MEALGKDKPDEVDGLQEIVSILESASKTRELTLDKAIDLLINNLHSPSFKFFCVEVNIVRYKILLPLCIDLDYCLVANPSGDFQLEFNLEKFTRKTCYQKLYNIKVMCMNDVREDWYYKFIMRNCNLGDTVEKVKEGLRRAR